MTELFSVLNRLDRIEMKLDSKFNNKWIDLKAACGYCGLSPSTLRRSIRSGSLNCSKTSGKLMFKVEWLDKWMRG